MRSAGHEDARARRRRGSSLSMRVATTAALIIVLSNAASITVQFFGFSPLGYRGRSAVTRKDAIARIAASADTKRNDIDEWFATQIDEAKTLAGAVAQIVPPDPLLLAAREGWDRASRNSATRLGLELARILQNKEDLAAVRIVDGKTGRILADTEKPPFGRAEDASWIGSSANIRIDEEGRCVVGYPFESPNGADLALLLYLRLDRLFDQIRADKLDSILGLDIAILDNDSRVVISSDAARFPPDALPLPLGALKTLKGGVIREVADSRGDRFLAGTLNTKYMGLANFRLFVSSRVSTIEKAILNDRRAALTVVVVATLAGLALVWVSMHRLFRPLVQLETSITGFAQGQIRPSMPRNARSDIAMIADAMDDLMDKVTDWRRELEAEVASRTEELRVRNAAALLFAHQADDESLYAELIDLISHSTGARRGVLAWISGIPAGPSCLLPIVRSTSRPAISRLSARPRKARRIVSRRWASIFPAISAAESRSRAPSRSFSEGWRPAPAARNACHVVALREGWPRRYEGNSYALLRPALEATSARAEAPRYVAYSPILGFASPARSFHTIILSVPTAETRCLPRNVSTKNWPASAPDRRREVTSSLPTPKTPTWRLASLRPAPGAIRLDPVGDWRVAGRRWKIIVVRFATWWRKVSWTSFCCQPPTSSSWPSANACSLIR